MKLKKRWWIILLLALLCGIPSWICISTLYPIGYPYTKEQQMVMFDQLNTSTLKELPSPPSVAETHRENIGLDNNELGRVLWVDYKINNWTDASATEVENYYFGLLDSKGWRPFGIRDYTNGTFFYYKGSACFSIFVYPAATYVKDLDRYNINIWYDYYAQSFSPPMPNLDLLERLNFGQLEIDLCPK